MAQKIKVGINGLGRIGRCLVRLVAQNLRDDMEIIAVNAPAPIEMSAHLLKYDSTHGVLNADINTQGNDTLLINNQSIRYLRIKNPEELPWQELGVDIVLECTGLFNKRDAAAAHLRAGANKVLISAPASDADLTVVYGVNHDAIRDDMQVISNASCTTNCLAPVVYVLEKHFGIESGLMNTIHSFTRDQRLVDSTHSDFRRSRAATQSLIPTKTGAANAIGLVIPSLAGKLSGIAVRVPTANVSLVDLTCLLSQSVTAQTVNDAMRQEAAESLKGVLTINELPLVSSDFNGCLESAIFDAEQTIVSNGNLLKVLAWYDNEMGFAARMFDTAKGMALIME